MWGSFSFMKSELEMHLERADGQQPILNQSLTITTKSYTFLNYDLLNNSTEIIKIILILKESQPPKWK